jgi:hypothetical protein
MIVIASDRVFCKVFTARSWSDWCSRRKLAGLLGEPTPHKEQVGRELHQKPEGTSLLVARTMHHIIRMLEHDVDSR